MKDYGRVKSTIKPNEKVIDEFSVWIASNIQEVSEEMSEGGEFIGYEYNLIQYDKDEYIKLLDDKNISLEQRIVETQVALCDMYEMLG